MNTIRILVMAALLTATAAMAYAQQSPAPAPSGTPADDMLGPPGQGKTLSEQEREEIRKKVEAVRIWKLTEELKLDAKTSAKLSALLSSLDLKRKDLIKEQMETMREVHAYLMSIKPDESKIRPALDKLERNRHAMQDLRDREWKGIKEILTTEQQARFLVFQQRFQREIRGIIAGARGNRGGGRMQGEPEPPDH